MRKYFFINKSIFLRKKKETHQIIENISSFGLGDEKNKSNNQILGV
jgi:hypothetical protein